MHDHDHDDDDDPDFIVLNDHAVIRVNHDVLSGTVYDLIDNAPTVDDILRARRASSHPVS